MDIIYTIHKCYSLHSKKCSLQYTMYIIVLHEFLYNSLVMKLQSLSDCLHLLMLCHVMIHRRDTAAGLPASTCQLPAVEESDD